MVKFLADEDFNQRIVAGIRRQQARVDFITALQAGVIGRPDTVVLKVAADSDRLLVTHDRNTMLRHFARFIASQSSPGLIIVSQKLDIGAAIDQLLLIWACMEAEELVNAALFVPL